MSAGLCAGANLLRAARAKLVALFLADAAYTHMLLCDADVE